MQERNLVSTDCDIPVETIQVDIDNEDAENELDESNTGTTGQGSANTEPSVNESEMSPPPPSIPCPANHDFWPYLYPPFLVVKLNDATRVSIPYPPGFPRAHPIFPDGFFDFFPDDLVKNDVATEVVPVGLQMFDIFTPDASDASRPPSPSASLWDFGSEESC